MQAATLIQAPGGDIPLRKKFTRAEVDQMTAAGMLEGQRLELIDGDLFDKMGQNPPHAFTVHAILRLLLKFIAGDLLLVQSPIEAAAGDRKWSLPEPDLAVLADAKSEYRSRFPRGDELVLVVEVADSSVRHDALQKRDLYARAGVPEYWVVIIAERKLMVHRHLGQDEYREVTTLAESESVAMESRPDARILVADMMP